VIVVFEPTGKSQLGIVFDDIMESLVSTIQSPPLFAVMDASSTMVSRTIGAPINIETAKNPIIAAEAIPKSTVRLLVFPSKDTTNEQT
jgi:hypothetical protein